MGAFYASWMDEARLEQLDAAPLKADLDRVAAINTKAEFAREMAQTLSDFGSTLFAAGMLRDPSNSTMNIAYVGKCGMACPTATIICSTSTSRSATPIAPISGGRSG